MLQSSNTQKIITLGTLKITHTTSKSQIIYSTIGIKLYVGDCKAPEWMCAKKLAICRSSCSLNRCATSPLCINKINVDQHNIE